MNEIKRKREFEREISEYEKERERETFPSEFFFISFRNVFYSGGLRATSTNSSGVLDL